MTEFDPYAELMQQKSLTHKLVNAHNQHDVLLVDMSQQFLMLVELVRSLEERIKELEQR